MVLVNQILSFASTAVPNPGPSRPPPANPVGAGESARPFGANLAILPSHKASDPCEPTMKLAPVQRLPSLSNINLPGAVRPPPVNLSGKTQALGAKLKYGKKGVLRSVFLAERDRTHPTRQIVLRAGRLESAQVSERRSEYRSGRHPLVIWLRCRA